MSEFQMNPKKRKKNSSKLIGNPIQKHRWNFFDFWPKSNLSAFRCFNWQKDISKHQKLFSKKLKQTNSQIFCDTQSSTTKVFSAIDYKHSWFYFVFRRLCIDKNSRNCKSSWSNWIYRTYDDCSEKCRNTRHYDPSNSCAVQNHFYYKTDTPCNTPYFRWRDE